MKHFRFFTLLVLCLLFCGQAFAQSFSGQITYGGSQTGNLHIEYATPTGPDCNTVDFSTATSVNFGSVSFPYNYTVNVPSAGNYCVAAWLDAAPANTSPPGFEDPTGVYGTPPTPILVTVPAMAPYPTNINITLYDPGTLTGTWNITANIDIFNMGGVVDCVYTGVASAWHSNNFFFALVSISTPDPMCASYTPLSLNAFCDATSYPSLSCNVNGGPGGIYFTTGTVSQGGNSITGTLLFDQLFSAEWTAVRQQQTTVPTLNQWGIIIFIIFAGFIAVLYIRRQRKSER